MVAYCTTLLAGGTCTPNGCPDRHDILRCEPCGCSFPADLLGQHSGGKKHLRNITTTSDPRVTVSHEGGLDFVVEGTEVARGAFFPPANLAIDIEKTEVLSSLSVAVKLFPASGTPESCQSSFRATFEGDSLTIRPGTERTVQIEFIPEFEGRFEATLQLIFSQRQQLGHFAVSRRLRAIAGSVEDHQRFESLNQEGYIPRSGTGQQIPPEKIVLLPSLGGPFSFGNLPEYKLPSLVQEAVDGATFRHPYNKKAPHLIATLRPPELTMDTYAKYFTALLNVEEGHQQTRFEILVCSSLLPTCSLIPYRPHSVEFENLDEDLLPEVIIGDFLWLEDRQEDVYYDARIANANVFPRGNLTVLKISLRVPKRFKLYRGAIFLLRFRLNRITLRRQYRALSSSLAHFRRLLFPSPSDIKQIQPLSMAGIADLPLVNENIREDDQQLQAVISILQQPKGSVPFIIFGPPGTGKTSTLVESIMQLLRRDASFKILACTPSNAAADLLVERLAAAGLTVNQLLRLNARSRVMKSIPELVRTFSVNRESEDLLAFRVVISTCSSAGLLQMENIPAGHFSHIVIDEAAQAEEPLALIPIAAFSNKDTNVILVGDPQQLGPVIKSSPASEAGLGKSFLERLIHIPQIYELDTQAGKTIVDLQRNRRSHGAIIAWPNRYLYKDRMHASASPDVSHLLLQSDVLPRMGFPIVFHGIKGRELRTQHSPSYLNVHEASVVRDYCLRLTEDREQKIFAKEIGVIAPYKAQVRAIRELLRPAGLKDVTVGSVEKLQGQERKVIIFATTRSNSEVDKRKAMGFLQNRRRMNVAITRAQALLIVVGDPEVLGKDELWRTFLNYACLREGWTGKAPNWNPEEHIDVPGYRVIPRPGGIVYGESYIDGKSENIYRFLSRLEEEEEEERTILR
ncbi:P-loop containing nucleoside triphosphate hydrolase protein [Lactarius pseudohatsudake]|nr:P-loop containing nucleoside triphosphate hydrolase protein [Lactarius pseudohatsudake]